MKKPVKLTESEILKVIDKRKHKVITVTKYVGGGSITDVERKVITFADEQGVNVYDVKLVNGWGGMNMSVRRTETDQEKSKRIRQDIRYNYESKSNEYRYWKQQQEREVAQAARVLNNNKTIEVVCKCNCNCSK